PRRAGRSHVLRLLRDRFLAYSLCVGRLALVGRRRARRVSALQRDGLARVQLGDAGVHPRWRFGRLHPPSAEHRADHSWRRAARGRRMTVAVLQAGSWGTTLATILARDGG